LFALPGFGLAFLFAPKLLGLALLLLLPVFLFALGLLFFASALIGGAFFRIGIGAIPFLLPLVLQIGLGMTAFQAGVLTFFSAAGALLMKFTAQPVVRRYGFRTVLIRNGFISSAFIGLMALFAYDIPAIAIVSVLLIGGFFRSLQFTCLNSMAYAEVSQERMSLATSLFSVAQQASLAIGVALAASAVELQRATRADTAILATDFVAAFAAVAAFSLAAIVFYLRLPPDAGAEMAAGPRGRKPVPST